MRDLRSIVENELELLKKQLEEHKENMEYGDELDMERLWHLEELVQEQEKQLAKIA